MSKQFVSRLSRSRDFGFFVLSLFVALGVKGAPLTAPVTKNRSPASAKLPATLTNEGVYLLFKEELEKSLVKTVQVRVAKSVKVANLLARAEDPWTFTNNLKLTETALTFLYP
jgi:hypothetical protein